MDERMHGYDDLDDRLPFAEPYEDDEESGLDDVAFGDECPNCGESNVDTLEQESDDTLHCLACGCRWAVEA